jgi:hypothetical protein
LSSQGFSPKGDSSSDHAQFTVTETAVAPRTGNDSTRIQKLGVCLPVGRIGSEPLNVRDEIYLLIGLRRGELATYAQDYCSRRGH